MTDIRTEPAPTFEDVWRLIQENGRQMREQSEAAARQFQEFREQSKEADREFQELRAQSKRTDQQFQELGRYLKELSKETDKKIGKLSNRLGEFVEGLIKPAVVRLFQARGIPVHKVYSDVSADNPELKLATQIDLLLINSSVCALIEVKSKLSIDDINEHLERMEKFKPLFPEYADKQAFGAVAAMVISDEVAKYAYRKGFFVLGQQGESVAILNDENFKPLAW